MEKSARPYVATQHPATSRPRAFLISKILALLVVCLLATTFSPIRGPWSHVEHDDPAHEKEPDTAEFDWDSLQTLPHLSYSPCNYGDLGDFQCARLQLPMDYWNGSTDATISLAVMR